MSDESNSNTPQETIAPTPPTSAEVVAAASQAPVMPKKNPPEAEGFVIMNPPLPVYRPLETTHTLRGCPVGHQAMPDGTTYYVMFLTEPTAHCVRSSGYVDVAQGELVLVASHLSLNGLPHLMPVFRSQADGSKPVCERAFELILQPYRKFDGDAWSFLVHARHRVNENAKKIEKAPSFALPDLAEPD